MATPLPQPFIAPVPAASPPVARPAASAVLQPPAVEPRRRALRRAAAFDLFDHCALGPPPRLLWRFVDPGDDVGGSIERFLRAVGADTDGSMLTRLLRIERQFDRLPSDRVAAVEADLLSENHARTAAAIAALRAQAGPPPPWPLSFLSQTAQDAWSGTSTLPRHHAAAIRTMIEDAAWAALDHRARRDAIADCWPDAWIGDHHGDALRDLLSAYDEAELRLLHGLDGDRTIAVDALAALNAFNRDLATMIESARALAAPVTAASAGQAPAPNTQVVIAGIEAAFAAMTHRGDATALWQSVRWTHHPDRPALGVAARAAAEAICEAADRMLDRLERSGGLHLGTAPQP